MATQDFSVKVNCQGENRRFTVLQKSSLEEFKKQCRTVFKSLQGIDFLVKYYDDEEDLITCEQEDEWVEAKRLTTRKNNLLKVSLVPGQSVDTSSVSSRSTNTSSDITADVKTVLSQIYKETETVTEELVSEAVKLLSSLVVTGKKPEEDSSSKQSSSSAVPSLAEEFVLDASRDTLELRPKQTVEHASIQQQKQEEEQPKKPAPNPLEQSWTFIEVKDEHHDEEEEEEEIPQLPVVPQELIQEPKAAPIPAPIVEEPKPIVQEKPIVEEKPLLDFEPKFEPPRLDSQFVADVTLDDGTRVEINQTVTKTWLLRNSGNVQWPLGTMMCYLSGPSHTAIELKFVHDVPRLNPNETTEISVQFKTPRVILGKQRGVFSLSDQFGKLFGQKFFFDIEVVEPKPVPVPISIPAPVPVPISQPPAIPSKYAREIETLNGMGFCDNKKSIELLEKHKGDLNLVIENLLS